MTTSGLRRWSALLLLAAPLLVLAVPGAGSGAGAPDSGEPRIARSALSESVRLMVQLQSSPLADEPGGQALGDRADQLRREHSAFRQGLEQAGIAFRELGEYSKLFNGMSVQVSVADAGRIAGMKGVSGIFISRATQLPTPQLFSSVKMIGAPRAWAGDPARAIPGVDGSGVTVAIIDTGIDYTHPDLGGCFGEGCRIVAGYDFVGDKFSGDNMPIPDPDPMDQNGHGTHVAGIIGASAASENGVTGVAPGVKFVSLKVFGPEGHTWDDIILQALETAYDMRVDVVNMSLGSAFQWPQYPTAQAVQRLADKGIVVVASAGNSGASGEFAAGAPAVGTGSLAVASFENDSVRHMAFLDPAGNAMAYEKMEHSPAPPTSGTSAELVYVGLGKQDSDFQNPDGSSKVTGKVALMSRGEVTFLAKSMNAKRFGAVQAVVFNNKDGFFRGTLQSAGSYIPTLSIAKGDGLRLVDLIKKGPVQVTWTDKPQLFASDTAGLLSEFSSAGPAPDLSVKPDVTAPGGSIYSTFPVAQGSYATLSGTSMSSPHVAGAAALVLQGRREQTKGGAAVVKPTAVRTLLMNTAQPRTEGPDSPDLYPVQRQGAGMIDAWRAITANQRVLPDKIALGAMKSGAYMEQTIVIENLRNSAETYQFTATGGEALPVKLDAPPGGLTVKARQTGHVKVSMRVPPELPDNALFSGWIGVIDSAGETVARIPYLGFKGDYQASTALDPLIFGLPWLARLDGQWLRKSAAIEIHPNCTCDAKYAWLIFSLARQPQDLRLEIWEPATGRRWGNAFRIEYVGRSDGGIELFLWDGTNDKNREMPTGTYTLRLMALRPLGDPNNPNHWDVWQTGTIKVVWD